MRSPWEHVGDCKIQSHDKVARLEITMNEIASMNVLQARDLDVKDIKDKGYLPVGMLGVEQS